MKSKNIFLTIAFALFLFGACTEEQIIDGPEVLPKGSITLKLASSTDMTKTADVKDGYQYATEEELTVGNCWVFVVDGDEIVKRQYFAKPQEIVPSDKYEGKYSKGYSVTIDDLNYSKPEQTYVFWVIGNPNSNNFSEYEGCKTLGQLKIIVEGEKNSQTASYGNVFADPTKLVKVGYSSPVSFNAQNTKTVQVPMTQLAARVSLTFNVTLEREYQGDSYEYYFNGKPIGSNGLLDYNALNAIIPGVGPSHGTSLTDNQVSSYKYGNFSLKFLSGKSKGFVVNEMGIKRITKYKGYALSDLSIAINGIRLNAQVGNPLNLDYNTQGPIYKDKTFEGINMISYTCKFYTYGTKSLNITLNGKVLDGTFSYEQEGTSSGYIISDADGINCKKLKEGTATDPLEFPNGWQGNISEFKGVLISNKEDFKLNGEVKPIDGSYSESTYNPSTFPLTPDNGFRDGYYYEGNVIISSVPVEGNLSVEIEPIKECKVSFGFD